MGWSISPNDTASINETTGVASFSANTEATDKKYTVTYTDEYGCSNSLEYTVPAFSACNPNPTFSNLTCDANGRHECTITTTNPCTTAVINYTLTDSAGNIASGGVNITKIGDYTFTASTTMVAGNVTVKWWNTADTSVSGTSTITSPGECGEPGPTPTEQIVTASISCSIDSGALTVSASSDITPFTDISIGYNGYVGIAGNGGYTSTRYITSTLSVGDSDTYTASKLDDKGTSITSASLAVASVSPTNYTEGNVKQLYINGPSSSC